MRSVLALISILFFMSSAFAADNITRIIKVSAGDHFSLGVAISDPDGDTTKDLKLEGGAEILDVFDDSEAERIGLDKKDVIVKFDGKTVKDAGQLSDQVDNMEKPKTVEIVVNRTGKTKTFTANLKEVEKSEHKNITVDIDDEDIDVDFESLHDLPMKLKFMDEFGHDNKGGFLGVEAKNIKEQMLEYLEVKQGVLIEAVVDDAPAKKVGLKAGDVITKINDREIKDYSDLIRTLNFYNPGEQVKIHYVRKGSSKSVKVELAEKKMMPRIKKIKKMKGGEPHTFMWHSDDDKEDLKIIEEEFHEKHGELLEKTGKLLKKIKIKIFII